MGIIGDDLLKKISQAEQQDDWDMVVELLAIAQLNATRNYVQLIKDMAKDTVGNFTGHMGE